MDRDSYRRTWVAVGAALIGIAAGVVLYAKGWAAGEKNGRAWGEINGRWAGFADMTKVLTDARNLRA